ncbi:unnamed protein product, partial [Polarella glacialis]
MDMMPTAVNNDFRASCDWPMQSEPEDGERCTDKDLVEGQKIAQRPLPTLVSFNAALSACERAGLWRPALILLQLLTTRLANTPLEGLRPDSATLNSAMSACEKGQQWQRALAILPLYRHSRRPSLGSGGLAQESAGPVRTPVTYGAAVSACVAGLAWELALVLLQEMRASSLPADLVVRNAALGACGGAWAWRQSLALAAEHRYTDVVGRSAAATALERAGQSRRAVPLLWPPAAGQLLEQHALLLARGLQGHQGCVVRLLWAAELVGSCGGDGRHQAGTAGLPTAFGTSDEWLRSVNNLGARGIRHALELQGISDR